MTRKEIRDRILRGLNESTTSPVFFTTAQIDEYIGDGQEILAEEVAELQRTAYVPRQEGHFLYSIRAFAPNMMAPFRCWLPEDEERLRFITIRELDIRRQRWWDVTAGQAGQPFWWFPVSWDVFGVWPGQAAGEGTLRVDYLAWPQTLQDDDDEPDFDDVMHDGLVLYGIYEGLMKQWDILRATDYFTQFVARWLDRRARDSAKQFQRRILYRDALPFGNGIQHTDLPF